MNPLRRALFALALRLGKTVGQLLDEMCLSEFEEWTRFFADSARAQDPAEPPEVDWSSMTPQQVGAMFRRK